MASHFLPACAGDSVAASWLQSTGQNTASTGASTDAGSNSSGSTSPGSSPSSSPSSQGHSSGSSGSSSENQLDQLGSSSTSGYSSNTRYEPQQKLGSWVSFLQLSVSQSRRQQKAGVVSRKALRATCLEDQRQHAAQTRVVEICKLSIFLTSR